MRRRIIILAGLLGIAGCEPEAQPLPFDVTGTTTRTLSSQGGTISSTAGAAIHFPSGSLPGSVDLGIGTVTPPAELSATGEPASEAFAITPEGLDLETPALVEMRFSRDADPQRAWLGTLVGLAEGILQPYGDTRVDLATGIAEAEVDELGTFAVVIPDAESVFPVTARSSSPSASLAPLDLLGRTDSVTVFCGGSSTPCTGISATATQNLLDRVEDAGLLYPAVSGAIRIGGSTASGSISASATVRVLLESGQTAESVVIDAVVSTTPGTTVSETSEQVVFTNVHFQISGQGEAQEEISTLVVQKTSGGGRISLTRSFQIEGSDGVEPASVSLEIPVQIHS